MSQLTRVGVRNYKNLANTSVRLGRFCVLVGPNGAGKSNFLDALAFVRDCLTESVEWAFRSRGGIGAVRRRSGGHPTHVGLRLSLELERDVLAADYSFEIAAKAEEQFYIARERCSITEWGETRKFERRGPEFVVPIPGITPQLTPDRLALYAASGLSEFRQVYDFLASMRFYSIVPDQLRALQAPDVGRFLNKNGDNAAAILKQILESNPTQYERLRELLGRVVPGLRDVESIPVGKMETLQFRQDVGLKHPWRFQASNMSDGTLRVLGLLLAIYQPGHVSLVGVEEPEATVHPAVADLLVQVLLDASENQQIVLTTHSPDILDHKEIHDADIRVVTSVEGRSFIAEVSSVTREAMREHLYSPGELLRLGELVSDIADGGEQARLFSE